MTVITNFRIDLKDFRKTDFEEIEINDLKPGEVLLQIYKFAFTSNNISYVNLGESFEYWKFFPTKEGKGIVPVWGFGKVIQSFTEGVKIGESFYGFFPCASHVLLEPGKVRATGFPDTKSHRAKMPSLYNYYSNNLTDPLYTPETENIQLIYRPLFTTAFLLDDFINENHIFGAKNIILTSASSKTALALAHLLAFRKKKENLPFKILGLTSLRNSAFIKDLNYFDEVYDYNSIKSIPEEEVCIIDFAGNEQILKDLNTHFGEKLKYLSLVGMVHWEEKVGNADDVKGTVFFAPTQMKKRGKEWGIEKFQAKLSETYSDFTYKAKTWLQFSEIKDRALFQALYLDTLEGRISPERGNIIQL